jgi:CRP/FNR family cyclic AMP-dependent transcriptional regulator
MDVQAGQMLSEEGPPDHEFFVVLDGEAQVGRNGRRIATPGLGRYFGELFLLDGGEGSASVVASSDIKVLVLDQRAFGALVPSIPGMDYELLNAMALRLREADATAISHQREATGARCMPR